MRRVTMIVALLLLVSVARPVNAQTPVFCGTLAAEDCTLLQNSATAMLGLQSGTADLNLTISLINVPGAETTDPISVSIAGNAAWSGTFTTMNSAMMTGAVDPTVLVEALRMFSGQLDLLITLPEDLMAEADPTFPNPVTLQLRLVNGVGYINFDTIPQLAQQGLTGWGGLDFAGFLTALYQQQPELFSGMNMGGVDPDLIARLQDPTAMGAYATITRVESNDPTVAVFETTVNFAAFFADPTVQDLLRESIRSQAGQNGMTLTDAEIDEALQLSTQFFQNTTAVSTLAINISDGFVRSQATSIELDLSTMMNTTGGMAGGMATPDATGAMAEDASRVAIGFEVLYTGYNTSPVIEAPANAQLLDYNMLLGSMGAPAGAGGGVQATPTQTATIGAAGDNTGGAVTTPDAAATLEASPAATVDGVPTTEATLEATVGATVEATVEATLEPTLEATP